SYRSDRSRAWQTLRRRRDGPNLLEQAKDVQLCPLSNDAAVLHFEHVDAAQLQLPAGGRNSRELTAVNAPPGDPIDDEVVLRYLVVDLVGVAGEHRGGTCHVVLEGGAVHGWLARHVCHKVVGKNLGSIVGRTVVGAD